MKRIIFLVILLTGISLSQVQVKTDPSIPFSFGYEITISDGSVDTLSRVLDSLAQIGAQGGYGSCNSLYDSLTSAITPFKQYWSASIIVDDTCQVSTVATFPAYERIMVLPDVPLTVGAFNKNKTNLYIRRFNVSGETGNPKYRIYVYGW